MAPLTVAIFSRGAGNQQYGLGLDAKLLELTFREMASLGKAQFTLTHKDPYTFMGDEVSDVHIYLEVPCRAAFPWAKVNVVMPNPEWWLKAEWSWVSKEPSAYFFYRSKWARGLFSLPGALIGWRCPTASAAAVRKSQVLYVVGGSINKIAALDTIVKAWKPEYPPLIIVASVAGAAKENVQWITGYSTKEALKKLQEESRYHCVASVAEGFGYTMAEAISSGAQPLWTGLPVFTELWSDVLGEIGRIDVVTGESNQMVEGPHTFTEEAVCKAVESMLANPIDSGRLRMAAIAMTKKFRTEFSAAWTGVEKLVKKVTMPSFKLTEELPPIGVITLVHNRPEWFYHAVRNIETSTYPRNKIHWIIVDDGERRVDSEIEKVRTGLPDLKIEYVSLAHKTSIGEKRNKGCAAALRIWHDIQAFAFMDDDDHYPPDSLTKRLTYLLTAGKGAIACATLPMYDLRHYISAMNVPPLDLDPCQRVSEATLCFSRQFWLERPFPNVSVAEGEQFLRDRDWLEISPRDIIVSFIHGKNSTSRRVPESQEANGCHYGFTDEYFTMIHQIASRA